MPFFSLKFKLLLLKFCFQVEQRFRAFMGCLFHKAFIFIFKCFFLNIFLVFYNNFDVLKLKIKKLKTFISVNFKTKNYFKIYFTPQQQILHKSNSQNQRVKSLPLCFSLSRSYSSHSKMTTSIINKFLKMESYNFVSQ